MLWTGHVDASGYGRIGTDVTTSAPRNQLVHRAVYAFAHGAIPQGMVVMHSCDNPRCINLSHLSLGTQKDNTDDMIAKGRHAWRERTPWQKLSAADAKTIRELRATGLSQQKIADRMGVSRPLISMLLGGKLQYAIA
jgi:hypothetical protein